MKNTLTKLAAAGVLTLSATAAAMAGSVTQPGETVGLALGAPLPPGFYFIDTSDWGVRDTATGHTDVGVTIPIIAWSTPWKVLGARVQFLLAAPAVESGSHSDVAGVGDTYTSSMYNPFLGGTLAWDLGGGFGFSYTLGAYIGVNDSTADPSSFLNNRFALSYTGGGWDLTAHLVYGTVLDTAVATHPDYLNLDLTATKTFGKWEVGAVGFYSTDLGTLPVNDVGPKQSQFAAGALVGYDFGQIKTQVYLTRDVFEQGYGGYDTRVWGRVILPLGDPFGTPAPSNLLYHK
jgi:hypothetical protein